MIVRCARIEESQQTITSENSRHGIHNEQIARVAIKTANAKGRRRRQLPVHFDVPHETAGTGVGSRSHKGRERTGAITHVGVVKESGSSDELARLIKKARGTRRIASEACLQQGNAVVEKPCSGAKDSFLIFSRRIGQAKARRKGHSPSHSLVGQAATQGDRQVLVDRPLVLDELFYIRG